MPANLENSAVATELEKGGFHSNSKERQCQRMFKLLHKMLKILQARLQQYVNQELPDVQARFTKGRGTRDQIANIHCIKGKKQENSRKISTSVLLTTPKPLTVWITTNCGKFLNRCENQPTLPTS